MHAARGSFAIIVKGNEYAEHEIDADEEGNILLKGIGTVTVTANSVTLHPGEYGQVRILLTPQGVPVSAELSYESDNEEIATVDDNGVILSVSPGTCVIKVQSSESDITAEYSVTVVEKMEEDGQSH